MWFNWYMKQLPILFSFNELKDSYETPSDFSVFVYRAMKRGDIKQIKRGLYALINPSTGDIFASKFQIASRLFGDAYFSYHEAIEYYEKHGLGDLFLNVHFKEGVVDWFMLQWGLQDTVDEKWAVNVENLNGTGSAGAANKNAKQAIRMMTDNLYAGFPSKVSVDHRPGTGSHADKIGDHFVVIRGVTEYLSRGQVIGAEYRFFDPGTRWVNNGTAGKFNLTNERLVGVAPYGSHRPYTVSSIRLCR